MTTSTTPEPVAAVAKNTTSDTKSTDTDCRTAYRTCMDEFCLLDESEGRRCACSSNIEQSKTLIQEIQKIQSDADNLYTEGVEREQLGAKAKLVFGESEKAKKSSRASGISFIDWLNSGSSVSDTDALDSDNDIGDGLYAMASEYCADKLAACGDRAEMEETLYARQIVSDCKSFNAYLTDQKTNARPRPQYAKRVWKCWIRQISTIVVNACWRIVRVSRTRVVAELILKTVWMRTCWGVVQMRVKTCWINVWRCVIMSFTIGWRNLKQFWPMLQSMQTKMRARHVWHESKFV